MDDLIVLTADGSMEKAIKVILQRIESMQIRKISFNAYSHPGKDPGCLRDANDFLRPFSKQYSYALVIFDHDGCGQEHKARGELEDQVKQALYASGWDARCDVIVIDPELEAWLWSDSIEVDRVLGWGGRQPDLRTWLKNNKYLSPNQTKPNDPKSAYEAAIRKVKKRKSSAQFVALASKVSLTKCHDPAFSKLRQVLMHWFPVQAP